MKILVLGHLVLDEIHTFDGKVVESLGGIYFPVSAFSALASPQDVVIPVFPVGEDAWDQFHNATAVLPRVDIIFCPKIGHPNTRVRLFHDSKSHYNTQLVSSLGPIQFDFFSAHLPDADLVYINMMTGHDITLETAELLRASAKAMIFLDLHMIAYHVGDNGHRSPDKVKEWQRWLRVPDVLQCNERELAVLVDRSLDESAIASVIFENTNMKYLVVTKGERGAVSYSSDGKMIEIPPFEIADVVDPTGCGDVFGTTLAYYLASGSSMETAGANAAKAAAYVVTIPGSIGMEKLHQHLDGETS